MGLEECRISVGIIPGPLSGGENGQPPVGPVGNNEVYIQLPPSHNNHMFACSSLTSDRFPSR